MQTVKLIDFLDEYQNEIAASIIRDYPPAYTFDKREKYVDDIKKLKRPPFLAQFDAICALSELFSTQDSGILVGEMGTGKSMISIATAYVCKFKNVLVTCPPHLVSKIEREVMITLPEGSVECHQLKKFTDVDKAVVLARSNNKMHFFILGRERAKLSYQWRSAFNYKKILTEGKEERKIVKFICCPGCGAIVFDKDGIPVDQENVKKRKFVCEKCKEPMWQAKESGPRRFAVGEWINRHYKGFFDFYIADEVHEMKGGHSAQGVMGGILAGCSKKSLGMTGTFSGGFSSNLFHLLYRFTKRFRDDYTHDGVTKWIEDYGILERVTKYKKDEYSDNASSKGKKYVSSPREKPGISPVILPKYLLDKTVFVRLSDIAIDLPTLTEEIVDVEMSKDQKEAYNDFYDDLKGILLAELNRGNKSLLAVYLQSLLTYPDRCTVGEYVYNKEDVLIASAPALNADAIYPKEEAIINLIKKEKSEGRKVLVFCTHTNRRDVTARLQEKIQSNGNNIRSEILKSNVPAEKREAWIKEHANDIDCLITNPALVQTGLDLIEFPTIAYCQSGYSVYTLRQSSRRSWRIGQDKPVKIFYFVYNNTMQEQALKLLAMKMKASLVIEGDLGDDGLATYNIGDDNLFYELARNIANNVSIEEGFDSIWSGLQEKEKSGSDLLIESLKDFNSKPDCLNGVLKIPMAEIKRKYTPGLWDKLYIIMMNERRQKQDLMRKRREKREKKLPKDRYVQIGLF